MTTYTITSTRFNVNPDGTQGQINLVTWSAQKNSGTVVGRIGPRGTPIPADYPPAQVEFQTLTPEDITLWIIDLEDQVSIEAQLDAAISAIEHPQSGSGLPWQDSYPLWVVGVAYAVGDVVIFQDIGYQCIQAHTSQSIWTPPATPALWVFYVPPSEGPQLWIQPTNATNAYPLGAQVLWTESDTHLWTSLVDANVWEPGTNATLWQDEGPYP